MSYLLSVLELFIHLMTGSDFLKERKHLFFWPTVTSPEASIWVPRAGLLRPAGTWDGCSEGSRSGFSLYLQG